MHGAASPFAWQGLSPYDYDVYQQAAQRLQPPAVLPPMPAQSPLPHMQSVVNPRLPIPWIKPDFRVPSPMDAYFHKLQEMNGFPSRSLFETSQSVADVASPSTLPAFHSLSDRHRSASDLYSTTENSLFKHDHVDNPDSIKEKMRYTSNSSQHDRRDLSSLPFLPPLPAGEITSPVSTNSSEAFSHLKWKNAYISPSLGSCSTPLNVSSPLTTSAELMPVSTAVSVIPYYSKPRDNDTYSMPNGLLNDAASREAARILEEANLSNMKSGFSFSEQKLNSPFTNISNEHRQQSSLPSENQGFHVPNSNNSYQPLQLKPPVDFRPENKLHSAFPKLQGDPMHGQSAHPMVGQALHRVSAGYSSQPVQGQSEGPIQKPPSGAGQGNFWSEFVLPPPNVELNQVSKNSETNALKRTSNFLSGSEDYAQAQKRQKEDETVAPKVIGSDEPFEKEKTDEKKKKDEKLTRRKSFSEDPVIEALVDAKVQEIMAACKEKQQTKTGIEKPQHVKTPKPTEEVRNIYDNHLVHSSNWSQPLSSNQSFQTKPVKNSVYDFDESVDSLNIHSKSSYKDLSHQVTDMRRYHKEKHSLKTDSDHYSTGSHPAENKFREKVKINEQLKQKVDYSNHHHYQVSDKIMNQHKSPMNGFNSNLNVNSLNSLYNDVLKKEDKNGIGDCKANSSHNDSNVSGSKLSEVSEKFHKNSNRADNLKSFSTGHWQFLSENKKMNMNYMDKYRGVNKKGPKVEKLPHKLKNVTKIERPAGQLGVTKKFGKPYGIKSSFTLHKKSPKFNNIKLPAIRKKWKNNPKYIKKPKDDFAEKLIKNLGFPPLTLKDLISRKQYKLPNGYNGYSTIAASMLSAEDKASSRGALPITDNSSTLSISGTSCRVSDSVQSTTAKVSTETEGTPKLCAAKSQRSRSAERSPVSDPKLFQRSRSWSNDTKKESGINHVDDLGMPVDKKQVKTVSEQVRQLHEQITGCGSNLEKNTVIEIPKCGCPGTDELPNEAVDGPYYTHLGAGRSVEAIRKTLEKRTGESGKAIRIEKVRYTGKEGKSRQGCPIAKWIVRRSGIEEKYLALVRHRDNHVCETAWLIIALVAWEGVPATQADHLYDYLSQTLPTYGNETERRCGTNDRKTCACQGADLMKRGASFSFGCSWSMYFNGCKFARSTHARKFRLKNEEKEAQLEDKLQALATHVGPLYQQCAPDAHDNQCYYSERAKDCRLGEASGKPFSGVTACLDFCAHAHKDIHNMNNGSTVVVTLTKHRGLSKPNDEQLHVLPLYVLDPTDEAGSYEGQCNKLKNGSLEVLHQFPLEARMRAHPLQSCKKRRMSKRGRGGCRQAMNGRMSPWDSSSSAQSTPKKDFLQGQEALLSPVASNTNTPVKQLLKNDKPISYDDLMSMSTQEGFNTLYDKFWDYFYAFGVFPPASILAASLRSSGDSKSLKGENLKLKEETRQQDIPNHLTSVNPVNESSVPLNMATSQDKQHVAISQDQHHTANMNDHTHHSSIYTPYSVQVQNPFSDSHYKPPPSYGDAVNLKFKENNASASLNHSVQNLSAKSGPIQSGVTPSFETTNQCRPVNEYSGNKHTSVQQAAYNSVNLPSQLKADTQALDLTFSSSSSKSGGLETSQNMSVPSSGNWESRSIQEPAKSLPQNHLLDSSTDANRCQQSPLDLLSKTVDMSSSRVGFNDAVSYVDSGNRGLISERTAHPHNLSGFTDKFSQQNYPPSHQKFSLPTFGHFNTDNNTLPPYHLPTQESFPKNFQQSTQIHNQYEQVEMNSGKQCWKPYDPNKLECHENLDPVKSEKFDSVEASLPDPDVVKCEMEYNEEAFKDASVGGVAIALSHRAVLFEVAKRELHATTGLKNPNRYHPTRISLVFYQHKNLNNERHGMYAYKQKMEDLKMKEMERMQLERGYVDMQEIENSLKAGRKQKLSDEEAEIAELLKSSKAEYKFMWNCNTNRCDSNTTETVSTKWIDPSPIVTGPYQKWI